MKEKTKKVQPVETNFIFAFLVWCYLQAKHEGIYSFDAMDVALSLKHKFNWSGINGEIAVSNSSRTIIIDRCKNFKLPTGKDMKELYDMGLDTAFIPDIMDAVASFNDSQPSLDEEDSFTEFTVNPDAVLAFVGKRSLRGKSYLLAAGTPKDERMYKDNDIEIFYQKIKFQYPDWAGVLEEMGIPEKQHDSFFAQSEVKDAYRRAEKRVASRIEAMQLKAAEEGNPAALNAAVKRMEKVGEDNLPPAVGSGFSKATTKSQIKKRPKEQEITV